MIRGTITPGENLFHVEIPALGMQGHATSPETAVALVNRWLEAVVGPEVAHAEVLAADRLDLTAPYQIVLMTRWTDPALLEAARVGRGHRYAPK
jgi:hypothetical protein